MTLTTIGRVAALVAERLVAFVAGCIFVACAAAILFEDVVMAHVAININHVLTLGVLSGTLLVGHLRAKAWREGHKLAAAGFFVLFVVGTGLVVYQSTGKQAEHTFASQAEADFAAEERIRIRPLLADAEKMLSDTAKKIQADCVEGKKSKGHCDGLRTTHGVYEGSVKGHHAALEKLGAPKPVAPEAESFATLAAVFGFDKAKVKAGAVLVVPFVRTILFELGGLWCIGFAFRPLPDSWTRATQLGQPTATQRAQTDFYAEDLAATRATILGDGAVGTGQLKRPGKDGNPGNGRPGGGPKPDNPERGGNRRSTREEFEADVLTRLGLGQSIESQDALADHHRVHKGVASKWLKDMRARGLIPAAQRVGRCHRLVAVDA